MYKNNRKQIYMHKSSALYNSTRRAFLFYLCFNKTALTVLLAKNGLFNFAGGIPRYLFEDDFPRSLIAGKLLTEFVDFVFRTGYAVLELDNGKRFFAQTLVGNTDNRNVLDFFVLSQSVLFLYRLDVFTAGYNDVLFTVNKVNEAVPVNSAHIARVKPTVLEYLV